MVTCGLALLHKFADPLVVVLQPKNDGANFFQKVLGAAEFDGKPSRSQGNAGRQFVKAGAEELERAALGCHCN